MSLDIVPPTLLVVFDAIDDCLKAKRLLPALMLMYATIDSVAALQRAEGTKTRGSFEKWVDEYLLPADGVRCSATDLYAARCAILHTLSTDADLIAAGKAKRLVYAWGQGNPLELDEASRHLAQDQIAIHVADLRDAVAKGINRFLDAANSDPALEKQVARAASRWLAPLTMSVVADFLSHKRGLT